MSSGGGFVWPPRDAGDETAPPLPDEQHGQRAGESAFERFERVWLGVESRSFGRRAALEGWAPAGIACWRCGTGVGAHEADGDGCSWCRGKRLAWDRFVRVGPYGGMLRDAILELKFERFRRTGDDLGRMIGAAIGAELDRRGIEPGSCVLVPVPTSWRNRMKRGVDHTAVLARGASAASGVPIGRVLRRRHGPTQTSVPASNRRANVRGRILARRGVRAEVCEGGVVIVLDDIRTTGATLMEACRAVRGVLAGGKTEELVWAASVAVTPEVTRREGAAGVEREESGAES